MTKDDESDYTPPPPRNAQTRAQADPKSTQPRKVGFHAYGNTGVQRYWTGQRWTSRVPQPDSISSYIVVGIICQVIGGFVVGASIEELETSAGIIIGFALITVGAYLVLVGVIAAGVRLGSQWSEYERDVRMRSGDSKG